jgi:hypothetical protein
MAFFVGAAGLTGSVARKIAFPELKFGRAENKNPSGLTILHLN